MRSLAPVMLAWSPSVAVSVWLPAVISVALKVPTPTVNVLLAGSTWRLLSLLLNAPCP